MLFFWIPFYLERSHESHFGIENKTRMKNENNSIKTSENMSVYTTCCRPQVCVLSAVQVCVRCVSPKQCCTKLILWYEGLVFFALWQFCWDTATSWFILFWEEQYVVLFVAWTSAVFYWPFLLKNIIFSCFIIILADLFLKLRAVIFILLFKIYLFCNFWEDLECKRSRRHGRNVLLTVVEGVPTPLITHTRTHAHTHLQKFWFLCLVIYLNQGHHCARGQAELALTLYLLIYSRL